VIASHGRTGPIRVSKIHPLSVVDPIEALGIAIARAVAPKMSANWGKAGGIAMTGQGMLSWGSSTGWVLRLMDTGMASPVNGVDVMEISRSSGVDNIADLGSTLAGAKQLLARVPQAIVRAQARNQAVRRPGGFV
jgi:hypothetical protein